MRIDKNTWIMIGLGSIIFHMFLIFSGLIPNLVSRPIHMAFAIPWIFLYSENDKKVSFINIVVAVLGVLFCLWIALNHDLLSDQYGFIENGFQFILSFFLLFLQFLVNSDYHHVCIQSLFHKVFVFHCDN